MAQLPPKIPPIPPIWYPFSHQTMSNYVSSTTRAATSTTAVVDNNNPSWVDEFLDFTSTKRGVHRRSISDSIAFLETNVKPLVEECHHDNHNNNNNNNNNSSNGLMSENLGFDRLDDEQLMSMFSDDMSLSLLPSTSNSSTPSDQNSNNDEKPTMVVDQQHQQPQQRQQQQQQATKTEPGEVESSCKQEPQQQHFSSNPYGDPIITDPKSVKRILANRQSAQRSRVRKLQYISELELSVTTLQTEVSALSPRVAFLDHQRLILNVDNSALKQRIAALAQDKIFKDAHQEALKNEIERLRQVYHQQNLQKMNNNNGNAAPLPPRNETQRTDKEELLMS